MAIDLNAVPGMPHATAAQAEFDQHRIDHHRAMDEAAAAEKQQYDKILRALSLYAPMKSACTTAQQTALGTRVGTKAAEQWTANLSKTAAILTGLADSMGTDLATLCTAIQAASLPPEFTAARTKIANATATDA